MSDTPNFLTRYQPPREVIAAAQTVSRWARELNLSNWRVLDCASANELTAAIARAAAAEATADRCKQVCAATAEGWRETQAELDEALAKLAHYETLRPIETAPTDGTEILLYRGDRVASGHYGKPDGWANPKRFVWPYIRLDPTHWTPLPDVKEVKSR